MFQKIILKQLNFVMAVGIKK
nr:putative protein [uncultured bacterium]